MIKNDEKFIICIQIIQCT